MTSMIISYDLRSPGRNYNGLYEKLKSYPCWAKITESTWFIKTNSNCATVRDSLRTVLDNNDRLFVGASTGAAAWVNTIGNSDYIKENL